MKTTMKIRMMLAGAACLCAALSASATEWTYSTSTADGKTSTFITNEQWKLSLGGATLTKDSTAATITWPSGWTDPGNDTKGVLDLRSPLKIKIGDDEATITSVALKNDWTGQTTWTANIVEFYCDILSSFPTKFFNNASKMTTLDIGGSATTFPCPLLDGCTSLVTAKFNFPGLRTVGDNGSLFSSHEGNAASLQDIDVSTIAGPGVTTVKNYALKCAKITGDLVLTNVVSLGLEAFRNAKLTCVSLAGSLSSLPSLAFEGSTITNVVLDLPSLSSINSTAFTSQQKIRRVELVTALSNMNLLTNIVASADNTDFKDLVIYVSTNQWTATATSGIFRELTDVEKSSAPDGAFGVFVLNGADKGVFVHKASHSDPDPIVEGKWTYRASGDAKTITDGQWTLKVDALTDKSNTLKVTSLKNWQAPSDTSKTGILDLRSPLKITVNGSETEIKSVEFDWNVFASWITTTGHDKISGFYCDILSSMGGQVFQGNHSIADVMIGGPAETIPEGYMLDCTGVTNIVLDLPNLKSVYDSTAVKLANVHSVEIQSAFSDMGLATNFVKSVSKTADQTGCRVYISKRQWTKEARDKATQAGYFAGMGTFTDDEKAKIAEDSTLARAYGVLVVGGVRKAFVVNKASPHDKIQGMIIIIQ